MKRFRDLIDENLEEGSVLGNARSAEEAEDQMKNNYGLKFDGKSKEGNATIFKLGSRKIAKFDPASGSVFKF
jgi:hypothetical protein